MRLLLGITVPLAISVLAGSTAFSQPVDEVVSATVSAQAVAISVTPDSIDYGVIPFGESRKSTTAEAGNVTFTAKNEGNVNTDLSVRGADATGDGFTWEIVGSAQLGCPSGDPDRYRHRIDPGPIWLTSGSNLMLEDNVVPDGEVTFTTEIYMPCQGSGGAGEIATTSITVTAVAS